ncbi:MAG: CPBP family intramembrane glutamic endopeptidase [Candidatus Auribacterota bacterium]|nr:CPBP family intramembrane glutamic endopeptidase [Candidatus Auribacterota bacterium]
MLSAAFAESAIPDGSSPVIDRARFAEYVFQKGMTPEIISVTVYSILMYLFLLSGVIIFLIYVLSGSFAKNIKGIPPVPWKLVFSMKPLFLMIILSLAVQMVFGVFKNHGFIEESPSMIVQMIVSQMVIVLVIGVFAYDAYKKYSWRIVEFLKDNKKKAFLYGFAAYLGFYPFYFMLGMLTKALAKVLNLRLEFQPVVSSIKDIRNVWQLCIYIVLFVIVAPVIEEVFFRGILYRGCKSSMGPWAAAFLSAFLFSAVHASFLGFLPIFGLGVAFTYIYEKAGSLYAPIFFHAFYNAVSFTGAFLVYRLLEVLPK